MRGRYGKAFVLVLLLAGGIGLAAARFVLIPKTVAVLGENVSQSSGKADVGTADASEQALLPVEGVVQEISPERMAIRANDGTVQGFYYDAAQMPEDIAVRDHVFGRYCDEAGNCTLVSLVVLFQEDTQQIQTVAGVVLDYSKTSFRLANAQGSTVTVQMDDSTDLTMADGIGNGAYITVGYLPEDERNTATCIYACWISSDAE